MPRDLCSIQCEIRGRDDSPIYLDDVPASEDKLVGADQVPNRRLMFAHLIVFEEDWFDVPDGDKYMQAKSIYPDGRFTRKNLLHVAAKAYAESLKRIEEVPEGRPRLVAVHVQREYDADKTNSAVRVWFEIKHET